MTIRNLTGIACLAAALSLAAFSAPAGTPPAPLDMPPLSPLDLPPLSPFDMPPGQGLPNLPSLSGPAGSMDNLTTRTVEQLGTDDHGLPALQQMSPLPSVSATPPPLTPTPISPVASPVQTPASTMTTSPGVPSIQPLAPTPRSAAIPSLQSFPNASASPLSLPTASVQVGPSDPTPLPPPTDLGAGTPSPLPPPIVTASGAAAPLQPTSAFTTSSPAAAAGSAAPGSAAGPATAANVSSRFLTELQNIAGGSPDARRTGLAWMLANSGQSLGLLRQALLVDNPPVQAASVYTLGTMNDQASLPAIRQLLLSPSQPVRQASAEALALMNDSVAVDAAERALTASVEPLDGFIRLIGETRLVRAAPSLGAILASSQNPLDRAAAAWALAEIGPPAAATWTSVEAALRDGEPSVRREAARAVAAFHVPTSGAVLQEACSRDPEVRKITLELMADYPENVEFLVGVMGLGPDQIAPDEIETARQSLVRLTGQDFNLDGSRWSVWFAENRSRFPATSASAAYAAASSAGAGAGLTGGVAPGIPGLMPAAPATTDAVPTPEQVDIAAWGILPNPNDIPMAPAVAEGGRLAIGAGSAPSPLALTSAEFDGSGARPPGSTSGVGGNFPTWRPDPDDLDQAGLGDGPASGPDAGLPVPPPGGMGGMGGMTGSGVDDGFGGGGLSAAPSGILGAPVGSIAAPSAALTAPVGSIANPLGALTPPGSGAGMAPATPGGFAGAYEPEPAAPAAPAGLPVPPMYADEMYGGYGGKADSYGGAVYGSPPPSYSSFDSATSAGFSGTYEPLPVDAYAEPDHVADVVQPAPFSGTAEGFSPDLGDFTAPSLEDLGVSHDDVTIVTEPLPEDATREEELYSADDYAADTAAFPTTEQYTDPGDQEGYDISSFAPPPGGSAEELRVDDHEIAAWDSEHFSTETVTPTPVATAPEEIAFPNDDSFGLGEPYLKDAPAAGSTTLPGGGPRRGAARTAASTTAATTATAASASGPVTSTVVPSTDGLAESALSGAAPDASVIIIKEEPLDRTAKPEVIYVDDSAYRFRAEQGGSAKTPAPVVSAPTSGTVVTKPVEPVPPSAPYTLEDEEAAAIGDVIRPSLVLPSQPAIASEYIDGDVGSGSAPTAVDQAPRMPLPPSATRTAPAASAPAAPAASTTPSPAPAAALVAPVEIPVVSDSVQDGGDVDIPLPDGWVSEPWPATDDFDNDYGDSPVSDSGGWTSDLAAPISLPVPGSAAADDTSGTTGTGSSQPPALVVPPAGAASPSPARSSDSMPRLTLPGQNAPIVGEASDFPLLGEELDEIPVPSAYGLDEPAADTDAGNQGRGRRNRR